jgi:hypothetical protein
MRSVSSFEYCRHFVLLGSSTNAPTLAALMVATGGREGERVPPRTPRAGGLRRQFGAKVDGLSDFMRADSESEGACW